MKSKKKVVILTEGQVKSLMGNLRVERDKRVLSEIKNQVPNPFGPKLKNVGPNKTYRFSVISKRVWHRHPSFPK